MNKSNKLIINIYKDFVKILESTILLVCFLSIKNDKVLFNKIIESI